MNRYITKYIIQHFIIIFYALTSIASAEGYKDTQGYKDYQKLPDSYKSPRMEAIYKYGYEAEKKVKNLPCVSGGTIEQCLAKKANVPAIDDLGWVTSPYKGGFDIERLMILGKLQISYRWFVDKDGNVKPVNGKAIGITRR